MRPFPALTVAVSAFGAAHAIRRDRPARMFGVRLPGTAAQHAGTIGTSLSAPPAMLAALLIADRTRRTALTRTLAAMFLIGILAEADTWSTLRRPTDDAVGSSIVVAEIVLPLVLLRS